MPINRSSPHQLPNDTPRPLPAFLPGRLTLQRGRGRDYDELHAFHYLPRRPATFAQVWTIRYHDDRSGGSRLVAVGVLSFPVPSFRARDRALGLSHLSRRQKLLRVNHLIRTISRVIVHPQFRCLGLSTTLVRCLCDHCDTRYIEAIAMMARAHPFFECAGMKRIEPASADEPVYFLLDREPPNPNSQVSNLKILFPGIKSSPPGPDCLTPN